MLIGYARISTADQNLDHLHDALHAAECQKIFDDTISGARAERPGLARVFDHLREGRARTNRSQTPPKREPKGQLKRYRGGGGLYGIEGDDSARMEVGYSQVD